jgi:hypothetical protein
MKIQPLHHFGASVYGSCLQLGGLGSIKKDKIMSNESGLPESTADY